MKKRIEIDEDRLVELYNAGYTHEVICFELGISVDLLKKRIKKLGLPQRKKPVTIDLEEFEECYFARMSTREIAEKFGIGKSRVASLVKALGLREKELSLYNRIPLEVI